MSKRDFLNSRDSGIGTTVEPIPLAVSMPLDSTTSPPSTSSGFFISISSSISASSSSSSSISSSTSTSICPHNSLSTGTVSTFVTLSNTPKTSPYKGCPNSSLGGCPHPPG